MEQDLDEKDSLICCTKDEDGNYTNRFTCGNEVKRIEIIQRKVQSRTLPLGAVSFEMYTTVSPAHNASLGLNSHNIHEHIKRIVLIPVTSFILIGNICIIYILARQKRFLTPAFMFTVSLGVADLFVGCASITTIIHFDHDSIELCLGKVCFIISSCVASIYSLMCIAIDRFVAISFALTYRQKMTKTRSLVGVFALWMVSFSVGFAPLFGWREGTYQHYCSFLYIVPGSYVAFLFIIGITIPMIIVFALYVRLYYSAKLHIKRIEALENCTNPRKNSYTFGMSYRNWKSLKTVVMVTGCLLITWCPFIVASVVVISNARHSFEQLKVIVGTYLLVLGISNSFLNPLIYAVYSKRFRNMAKQSVRCLCVSAGHPDSEVD